MNYDLYLFDLDGTIIDSEKYHYYSYLKSFQKINKNFDMSYDEYCAYKHNNDKSKINYFFNEQEIKKAKEEKNKIFEEYIQNNCIKLINNFDKFLELLLLNDKKIGIVTLSPLKRIKLICNKIPVLNKITKWTTNEKELDNKTSLYIKMISKFNNISLDKIIIFEDSLLGFNGIKNLNVNKVLINNEKYIYYNDIYCINKFPDYTDITLKINKIIDTVFIFAAGNGTRLKPFTNHIPKILVNIDNDNILTKIINYWKNYTNKFVIIINKNYVNIIDFYMKQYSINFEIKCINITNQENAYTIKNSINDQYYGKNILFTWCDIYPTELINPNIFSTDNIIFLHGNKCRYSVINNQIIKMDNGNIIGIYYFYNYKPLINYNDNMDLCDCYSSNYDKFITYNIKSLVDIGDMDKLNIERNILNKLYKTRYFNKIEEINDSKIKKLSLNKFGDEIIKKEQNWYKIINSSFVPKIYEYNETFFIMEKLKKFHPLYLKFKSNDVKQNKIILINLIENILILHQKTISVETKKILQDVDIEFNIKIINRLNDISQLINNFKINKVNNVILKYNITEILTKLNNKIKTYIITNNINKYKIIHGDCHFSNILYNEQNNDIKLIDPRGYFGQTLIYGLPEYDYSKIIYSISGFDEFNSSNDIYLDINKENLTINIKSYLDIYDDFIISKFKTKKNIIYTMIIIHWIGLAQYTKNNIAKCIIAYYYGIYLYHKNFNLFVE